MRQFHLNALLSITTGFLCPVPGTEYPIDCVYDILNFMTSDDLYTHALPRVSQECKPYLLEAHPFLDEISLEDLRGVKDWSKWETRLQALAMQYGEWHEVRPIHFEDHEVIDPIEELQRMKPDAQVIVIDLTEDDEINPTGDIS